MLRVGSVASKTSLIALVIAALDAQSTDPQALLEKVRSKVSSTVQRAPRYSCVETIERFWYANRKPVLPGCDTDRPPEVNERNLVKSDRLRLDVAVGSGQEIFSWHGQKRFQTEEIDRLVTAGPISSGTYFSFLSSVFLEGSANIDFRGFHNEGGKQFAIFEYSVPADQSKFETRIDSGKEVMGYHGKFAVDSTTGSLDQLDIVADEIPKSARVCTFDLKAHYGMVSLNGAEFQLPRHVDMDITDPNHEHTRTVTRYQECRQFLGESIVHFDSTTSEITPVGGSRPAKTLPSGLRLQIRIKSSTNPETAWAGDAVRGELANDILDEHGLVIVPKGAPVQGRLLRLESWVRPYRFYTVALQFQELTFANEDYMLNLKSIMEPTTVGPTSIPRRMQLESPPISDEPGACRFRLDDRRANLKGVITRWMTN